MIGTKIRTRDWKSWTWSLRFGFID